MGSMPRPSPRSHGLLGQPLAPKCPPARSKQCSILIVYFQTYLHVLLQVLLQVTALIRYIHKLASQMFFLIQEDESCKGLAKTHTCTSQIATVASKLAVARDLPSGDQLQQRMVLECASSRVAVQTHWLPPGCLLVHSLTVLSPLQLASVSPALHRFCLGYDTLEGSCCAILVDYHL